MVAPHMERDPVRMVASFTPETEPIRPRVLVVDDDPRFRALARTLLQASGCSVVGDAADGAQAVAAADRLRPDAALVDVQLPDTDGLALARTLTDGHPGVRVVMTSTDRTLVDAAALAACGAVAFVPKDELAITDLTPWLQRTSGKPNARP